MKTQISKIMPKQVIILFAVSVCFLLNLSCEKDNSDGDILNSEIKTYSGAIKVAQNSIIFDDLIDLSFEEKSSTKGTFFRKSDGVVGVFTGNSSGNSLSIKGYIENNPSFGFTGTIQFNNNNIVLNISGTNNIGSYTCIGTLGQQQCIELKGTYYAQESFTYTITMQGESESETQSGDGTVVFDQSGSILSYSVPGTNTNRKGELIGNKLILSGQFVIPASNDVVLSENTFKAEVTIIDKYHFEFKGIGSAKGSYQGNQFTIKGTSSGVFDRRFKVAIAFLHGGPNAYSLGNWNNGDELGLLRAQAQAVDNLDVITLGVSSSINPSQISIVDSWFKNLNKNSSPPNLILVGHSLGGNAVTNSMIQNVYYRITIDPWTLTGLAANQRNHTFMKTSTGGGFKNILASGTNYIPSYEGPYGLLGYKIANLGSNEWVEDETNHFSVVHRVWEKRYVKNEVQTALNSYESQNTQSTLGAVYSNPPFLKGKQPCIIKFGWNNINE